MAQSGDTAQSAIGIDIGGTFTDLSYIDGETGERISEKAASTEDAISGIVNVFKKADIDPDTIRNFGHGSTIATNAIIEQTGAYTALVTTANFPDVLEAARANRPELFDLTWEKAEPVVARRDILGVNERVRSDGSVETELDEDDVYEAAALINKRGYEAVAISYLNAFINPEHERRTLEILTAECPDTYVTASSDVVREIGEFERTSTTSLNAYLGPLIADYLDELDRTLSEELGYDGEVTLINSAGGAANKEHAVTTPARFCNSGPAGGVTAAQSLAEAEGYQRVIPFDMGGTSADLSLVDEGGPEMTTEWRVEWNKPILFPAIDITTIGAGGGSIAWVDEGGALKVGPRSAGSTPGPACYDQGGTEPTVTDANLVLNRLNEEMFLGGDMDVVPEKSREVIVDRVGQHFGWDEADAAEAVLQVAINNMANAIRGLTVERGNDPRNFTMVAYGGAGPMHAAELAAEIDIPRVLVPRYPGVGSAFGVAQPEYRFDYLRPILQSSEDVSVEELNDELASMDAEMRQDIANAGLEIDAEDVVVQPHVDLRYYGQTSYINLDAGAEGAEAGGDGTEFAEGALDRLVEEFTSQFEAEFGYTLPENISDVEVVNVRLTAAVQRDQIEPQALVGEGDPIKDTREVWFDGELSEAPVYARGLLDIGTTVDGPAIVEQSDTTVVVPPTASATVTERGSLVIDISSE